MNTGFKMSVVQTKQHVTATSQKMENIGEGVNNGT